MTRLHRGTLWIAAALLAVAVLLMMTAGALPGLVAFACWAFFLVAALAIERWRYKGLLDAPPGPDWKANGERFVDPESGRTVVVYEHPGSGRRAYVAADRA